jgi:ABC-type multidrug transport system fused ATPase/permease subunit
VESGRHDDLLHKGGPYSRLFNLQFSKVLEHQQPELLN